MRSKTFAGGVHPLHASRDGKAETRSLPVVEMPAPEHLHIPMVQNIGTPCQPVVKKGQRVLMGEMLGKPSGFVGAPVHSPCSGEVISVGVYPHVTGRDIPCVAVKNDFKDEKHERYGRALDWGSMEPKAVIDAICDAGIVGMGGATFPTHVKLSPPEDRDIDTLILNGAECEPYLSADHRLMLENPGEVAQGIRILMKALNVKKAVLGIEDNKMDAVEAMDAAVNDIPGTSVYALKVKYPQGSEKQLIEAVTGRQVPSGGLPMDAGVVVVNVGTAAAVCRAMQGIPLIQRILTVSGCVQKPQNLLVRIGTSFEQCIEFCGGYTETPGKILSGGPMMGFPVFNLSVSVVKGTSGILVFNKKQSRLDRELNCIRCGQCARVCPVHLMPLEINARALRGDFEGADTGFHALDCTECGCCSYTCPSKRLLLPSIRLAKFEIMRMRQAQREKKEGKTHA